MGEGSLPTWSHDPPTHGPDPQDMGAEWATQACASICARSPSAFCPRGHHVANLKDDPRVHGRPRHLDPDTRLHQHSSALFPHHMLAEIQVTNRLITWLRKSQPQVLPMVAELLTPNHTEWAQQGRMAPQGVGHVPKAVACTPKCPPPSRADPQAWVAPEPFQ